MNLLKLTQTFICFTVLLFVFPLSFGVEVQIDANGYQGRWRINSLSPQTGIDSVDIGEGTHSLSLVTVQGNYVELVVASDSSVESTDPTKLRQTGPRSFELVTYSVPIVVGGYSGRWRSGEDSGVPTSIKQGDATIQVPRGDYTLRLVRVSDSDAVYTVGAGGTLSTASDSLEVRDGQLSLVTFPIHYDVNGYHGEWWSGIDKIAETSLHVGNQTLEVAPGTYEFKLRGIDSPAILFTVHADGSLTSTSELLVVASNRLELLTYSVEFDIGGFQGEWWAGVSSVSSLDLHEGDQSFQMPPASYTFRIRGIEGTDSVFTLSPDGTLASSSERLVTTEDRISLVTFPIKFQMNGYPGHWWSGVSTQSDVGLKQGDQLLMLTPATYEFRLRRVDNTDWPYTVNGDGSVSTTFVDQFSRGAADELILRTYPIEFDVSGAPTDSSWAFGDVDPRYWGNRTLCLPEANYEFRKDGVITEYSVSEGGGSGSVTPAHSDGISFSVGSESCQSSSCDFLGTIEKIDTYGTSTPFEVYLERPAINGDGSVVVFSSPGTDVVPGDTNRDPDLFVFDFNTNEMTRVNVTSSGEQAEISRDGVFPFAPYFIRFLPSISDDGRIVAFNSRAQNLVAGGDRHGGTDIFTHDRVTGETTLITVTSEGEQLDGSSSGTWMSGNGRKVAFITDSFMLTGDLHRSSHIAIHDRMTRETTVVIPEGEVPLISAGTRNPALNFDGTKIAFCSDYPNFVPGDTNEAYDYFIRDLTTGETAQINLTPEGLPSSGDTYSSAGGVQISSDGNLVTFYSNADDLVPGLVGRAPRLFLRDLRVGHTRLVTEMDHHTFNYSLSKNGQYIAFNPIALHWSIDDPGEIFIYNISLDSICPLTELRGIYPTAGSRSPVLSADGSSLAFISRNSDLVPGDLNGLDDVFVYRLHSNIIPVTEVGEEHRIPDVDPHHIDGPCGLTPHCREIIDSSNFDRIREDLISVFDGPDFPPIGEDDIDIEGFSFFVPLGANDQVVPLNDKAFSLGDFELLISRSQKGLNFKDVSLVNFVEVPLDIDRSGFIGDFEGEGVFLFFADTLELQSAIQKGFQFDLTFRPLNQSGIQISEPVRGLPPLMEPAPEPSNDLEAVSLNSMCRLEEGIRESVSIRGVHVNAALLDNQPGELVAGAHVPQEFVFCGNEVTDLLISDSSEGSVDEFAYIDFNNVCEQGGLPGQTQVTLYAGEGEVTLIAYSVNGNEVDRRVISESMFRTSTFEDPDGIERIELIGEQISILSIGWNCEIEVREDANQNCFQVSQADLQADGSYSMGAVNLSIFDEKFTDQGLGRVDFNNDGVEEISLPYSEIGEPLATLRLKQVCQDSFVPQRVTLQAWAEGISLFAFDSQGDLVDSVSSSFNFDHKSLTVLSSTDISLIEIYGSEIYLSGVCIDCVEISSGGEKSFRRGDCNQDGQMDITDVISTLDHLFLGRYEPACMDACDTNDDQDVDITDAIAGLSHLFLGLTEPAPPGKETCGFDPTEDALGCEAFSPCAAN